MENDDPIVGNLAGRGSRLSDLYSSEILDVDTNFLHSMDLDGRYGLLKNTYGRYEIYFGFMGMLQSLLGCSE